jgi:hypothetical protein
MAEFPPDWDIYEERDFATFNRARDLQTPLAASTLIRLNDEGRSMGIFRIILFGGGILNIDIPVSDVLPDPPPSVANQIITLSARADKLAIASNSTTSSWRDLLVLLDAGIAKMLNPDSTAASPDPMIRFLHDHANSSDKSTVGVSIRWAVAVDRSGDHNLEIQSLPTQARYLTKANLKQDNSVSVLLGSFPLCVDLFQGQNPGGPVPLFFAADRDKASDQISKNPDAVRADIAAVNATLLHMEHLSLAEAHAYLQGRARAAKGVSAYPNLSGPPTKRPRTAATMARETGSFFPPKKSSFSHKIRPLGTGWHTSCTYVPVLCTLYITSIYKSELLLPAAYIYVFSV